MSSSEEQIHITLTYAGQLAGEAGCSQETLTTRSGTSVAELVQVAAEGHGEKFYRLLFDENGRLRRALVISVDDNQVEEPGKAHLKRDHDVFLMTPIAGG